MRVSNLGARRIDRMKWCIERRKWLAQWAYSAAALAFLFAVLAVLDSPGFAAPQKDGPPKQPAAKVGLSINDPKAFQGYSLLAPLKSKKTYLLDMQGRVVRTWESDCSPALSAYLLENGHLLRAAEHREAKKSFGGPGAGGCVQEWTWEGELVWDFKLTNDKQLHHHDILKLPNGNVLMVVWDKKSRQEAIDAGRRPDLVSDYLLPDSILEVQPTGKTTGKVVWEWHLWDHLIQDHDKTKANYGKVAEHPELVDVNFTGKVMDALAKDKGAMDKLKSIGYVGSPAAKKQRVSPDWTHVNAVAYNAELDQIVISIHEFSEIWIIDHGTTTAEAAGHKGGRHGKGGDLLYRWGNPAAYRAGTVKDQRLFAQHNAHWIPRGRPGEGHLLVFNNGVRRPEGTYSSVDEIVLPVDAKGRYAYKAGTAFGPDKAVWTYTAPKKSDFFSMMISGAERMSNGNTLICSGASGIIFEVTPESEVVWKYVNPTKGGPGGKGPGGFPGMKGKDGKGKKGGFGPPPKGFQLLPPFLRDALELTADQNKQLDEVQKAVEGKLDQILKDEQKNQFKEMQGGPKGFDKGSKGGIGFGAPPQPGQILSPFQQARLKLTDDQKKEVAALQKEADGKLDKTFTADQRKRFKEMSAAFARGGPGGFGPGGKGGFGPGGPGGIPGFGPGAGAVFRVYRYAPNYPGLAGRDLTPGRTVEEMERQEPKEKKSP
jgi:hypothetical protein